MECAADLLPVIVGVGRLTQRIGRGNNAAVTPLHNLIAASVRCAAADAVANATTGADVGALLSTVECMCCPGILTSMKAGRMWMRDQGLKPGSFFGVGGAAPKPYANMPKAVARASGCDNVSADLLYYTGPSGTMPQWFVSHLAERIAAGELRCCVVAGGEAEATLKVLGHQRWEELYAGWNSADIGTNPVWVDEGAMADDFSQLEVRHDISEPASIFPMYEQALRTCLGRSIPEHTAAIAGLCSGMAGVAAHPSNTEHAWFPQSRSAAEIATPSLKNPYNYFPYTKLMNAMPTVDMSAAMVLMSAGLARQLLGPTVPLVYLHGCGEAREPGTLLQRPMLHRSPPIEFAAKSAYKQAGIGPEKVAHWEIYACFPASVGIAARECGAPTPELGSSLTKLGGLMYHGGPGANYVTHALCALTERLRKDQGKYGLVYAPGGMNTKHVVGIYNTTPPVTPWRRESPLENKARMAALPLREVSWAPCGRGRIETYTVKHKQNKPMRTIVIGTLMSEQGGERFVAVSEDMTLCISSTTHDLIGSLVDVTTDSHGKTTFVPVVAAKL